MIVRTIALIILVLLYTASTVASAQASDSTNVKSSESRWKLAARIGSDWEVFMADDPGHYESGIGFDFELIVPISHRFAITATYFKSGIRADKTQTWSDTSFVVTGSSLTYDCRMYLLGMRYQHTNFLGISFLDDHWFLKAGDITQDYEGSIWLTERSSGSEYLGYPYERVSDFAVLLGFGFSWKIAPAIGVDIGFQRILKFDKSEIASGRDRLGMWQTYAIRGGVTVGLLGSKK